MQHSDSSKNAGPIVRRFQVIGPLSREEIDLLARTGEGRRRRYAAGTLIVRQGDDDPRPEFMISGWAANERFADDERTQFVSLLVPGDSCGICTPWRPVTLASVRTLTEVETVDGEAIRLAILQRHRFPGIAAAYDALNVEEDAALLDHVVRLASGSAVERLAHLLMELRQRCSRIGLGDRHSFPLPLTQAMLGSLMGLSQVQVNRTLKELRENGLIATRRREVVVRDAVALARVARFKRQRPAFST